MKRFDKYISDIYQNTSRASVRLLDRAKMTEHIFMIVLAIIIGILGGFGAVGIRALIDLISEISFQGEGSLLTNIKNTSWYWIILIPAIGGLIVGPIIYFFAPEAKGHGVPEVMQSVILKGGIIRPRVALVKAFASAVTIGTGGSVGREGPIIQIGSSLGSTVGQFFRLPTKRLKTLVGCGAAAGIAAAFNAPIAGALFAVEIILMDFAIAQFTPIVIASVMATVVSHMFEGDFAAFPVPVYILQSPYEIIFYFLLGIFSGIFSYLFIKILYFFEDLWDEKIKIPAWLKATIGGAIVGSIALLFPEILGVGYETIGQALNLQFNPTTDISWGAFWDGEVFWLLALVLIFVKILSSSMTLGSGGSGGIFAPSLFMGAMLGAFVGYCVNYAFPDISAPPGAYALVAMGGLVAGTTRAPLTAIIIVFELTKETTIILPLMIVCTISTILSSKLSRESIYTLKLLHRNIKIKERAEVNIMKSLHIGDIFSRNFDAIPEDMNFSEVVNTILTRKTSILSVNDMQGRLLGIISIDSIKDLLLEKDTLKYVLIAGDIADKNIHTIKLEDSCKKAMEMLGECDYEGLPVVDSSNPKKQIGVIWRKDIDDAYHKEIDRIELTSDLATKISADNYNQDVVFMEGYLITELKPPTSFIGRSLKDLAIRSIYGVDVLSVKRESKSGRSVKAIPAADYIIRENDHLIVAGEAEKINILKNLS